MKRVGVDPYGIHLFLHIPDEIYLCDDAFSMIELLEEMVIDPYVITEKVYESISGIYFDSKHLLNQ